MVRTTRKSHWIFAALLALIWFGAPAAAHANKTTGRPVVRGQIQDVFFTVGSTETKTVPWTYTNYGFTNPGGHCGVYAGATAAGIKILTTYGFPTTEAEYPFTAGVGPSVAPGYDKPWTIDIKVTPSATAGVSSVDIYAMMDENCPTSPAYNATNMYLIGKLNVYVVSSGFDTAFTVTATSGNTSGSTLTIDHPATNGSTVRKLFVTHNWNPGSSGQYDNNPIGVKCCTGDGKWQVVHENGANIPLGTSFNVRVDGPGTDYHVTAPSNISNNWSYIDSPISNGNPYAQIFVTHVQATGWPAFSKNFGVWYDSSAQKWGIFTQDGSAMPTYLLFSVKIHGTSGSFQGTHEVFTQSGNVSGNSTMITKTSTQGHGTILIVTPNWNPPGMSGTYNNHVVGVWYSAFPNNWGIFNQDIVSMPSTAAFNVWEPLPRL